MTQPSTHGGYRAPANPASVSGPGAMSRRTDGNPAQALVDAPYGEQKTFQELQSGAPMGGGQPASTGAPPVTPIDTAGVTPLGDPSQMPNEPITAGADVGAGPGSAALGGQVPDPAMQYSKDLLPVLTLVANMPWASVEFRQMVRRLRAS